MIESTNQEHDNETVKTLTDYHYNSFNPYMPSVVEHITDRKYRKASGLKWEEVLNPHTGELEKKSYLVLGEQKKLDKQEFYKVYRGAIKSFHELSEKAMDLFDYIMSCIKYDSDRVCLLQSEVLTNARLSKSTYFRCLVQLIDAKIIAKADREGCFFINPSVAFKGDRITLVKQFILDTGNSSIPEGMVREDEHPYGYGGNTNE